MSEVVNIRSSDQPVELVADYDSAVRTHEESEPEWAYHAFRTEPGTAARRLTPSGTDPPASNQGMPVAVSPTVLRPLASSRFACRKAGRSTPKHDHFTLCWLER
ncbi:hypothetical protein B7C42_07179 [Nocardia cerradoensis]|uniref:Uncharacterized protein n=1 Tax=Nocardia cerradoensis TaxID=85688 RepID=A0A231GW13_9NOCA|nr:hypothetical protein B7C42_07179 [Nocardia cerradoensis]